MKSKKSDVESLVDLLNVFDENNFYQNILLSKSQVENYKNNTLFSECFPLTDDEVAYNVAFLDNIIKDDQNCKLESKYVCPTNGYHLQVRRNSNNLLSFYYQKCQKVLDLMQMKDNEKNVLYSSYPISKEILDEFLSEGKTSLSKNEFLRKFKTICEDEKKLGIYIHGKPGVGKTFLFKFLLNKLILSTPKKVAIIFMPDLVEIIKSSFSNKQSSKLEKINNAIKNADILFFDDVGSEFASDWFYSNYFLSILNVRIESKKLTFFSSNLTLNQYSKKIADSVKMSYRKIIASRVIDRIRRLIKDEHEITDKRYVN